MTMIEWYKAEWDQYAGPIARELAEHMGQPLDTAISFMLLTQMALMRKGLAEAWTLQKPVLEKCQQELGDKREPWQE